MMYTVQHYDDLIPEDIHNAVYEYLQDVMWHSEYRHIPHASVRANQAASDLIPYLTMKTVYSCVFGKSYEDIKEHLPIVELFDYINKNLFDDKFILAGKPLGTVPFSDVSEMEVDDFNAEKQHEGHLAYMHAEGFETVKRTRVPYRDWDNTSIEDDGYYTIAFVANKEWNPVWHAEMFFYRDHAKGTPKQGCGIGEVNKFITNIPGRVILYDSRVLHNSKPTGTLANEIAQRVYFRVKLKDGETLV